MAALLLVLVATVVARSPFGTQNPHSGYLGATRSRYLHGFNLLPSRKPDGLRSLIEPRKKWKIAKEFADHPKMDKQKNVFTTEGFFNRRAQNKIAI